MQNIVQSIKNIRWKTILYSILGIVFLTIAVVVYFNYFAVYSTGYRSGTLIKFSHKGWLFKTYEGEINQGGVANPVPGTMMSSQIWPFSVSDNAVAEQMMQMEGKVVSLHYKQYKRPLVWRGESNYLIDEIKPVD